MSICKQCGVDLGKGIEKCPLCEPADPGTIQIASPADLFRLSKKVEIRTLYEITMLLLISGVFVTLAIDIVFGKGMSWSLMTTTCIGYLIVMVTSVYFLRTRPYMMIAASAAGTLLFLWLIDFLTGNHGWFTTVAAPLAISGALLTMAVIFLNSLSRYRGLNLLSTILIAMAIYTIITEFITDRLLRSAFNPQWSVVTAASLLIIAFIFLFVHYRLKRGRSLGRFFHL
jgi:hypothetical protein